MMDELEMTGKLAGSVVRCVEFGPQARGAGGEDFVSYAKITFESGWKLFIAGGADERGRTALGLFLIDFAGGK